MLLAIGRPWWIPWLNAFAADSVRFIIPRAPRGDREIRVCNACCGWLLFVAQKGIHSAKRQSRPERASSGQKGILGPKREFYPERASLAWRGVFGRKGHSSPERGLLAQKGTCGSKGHLSIIISMTVSDRRPSMWLGLFFGDCIWQRVY